MFWRSIALLEFGRGARRAVQVRYTEAFRGTLEVLLGKEKPEFFAGVQDFGELIDCL